MFVEMRYCTGSARDLLGGPPYKRWHVILIEPSG
jgi:hypothetical protein